MRHMNPELISIPLEQFPTQRTDFREAKWRASARRASTRLTCQLTRLDRFSTVRRYSVRSGGPYRDEFLQTERKERCNQLEPPCMGRKFKIDLLVAVTTPAAAPTTTPVPVVTISMSAPDLASGRFNDHSASRRGKNQNHYYKFHICSSH